jgi:cytochrome c oxidase assembly protein subunit 15
MKRLDYNPWLHRFAVLTAALSLLPIVMGALTTTTDAGMAFPDWPTSDGQNMLTYPWWQSAGAKFIEHGHRLAGMLIGFVSIILVGLAWKCEKRVWARRVSFGILLAVIFQGLLGGSRVRMDEAVLALIHGNFAAWVFTLMVLYSLWTSRSWLSQKRPDNGKGGKGIGDQFQRIPPLVIVTPIVIMGQYILGGMLRHLHTAMNEHLLMAFVALGFTIANVVVLHRSKSGWLRSSAWGLLFLVVIQIALGAGSWVTRFGFASIGYVAIQQSGVQIWVRSAHTVVGMVLFATSIVALTKYARLVYLQKAEPNPVESRSVVDTVRSPGVPA